MIYQILGPRDWKLNQKVSKRGLLQGRYKFITQFRGQQCTTCGQEASKIRINKTFISVEIQTIYKSVFIYQILGPRDWTLSQKVSNKNSISTTGRWNWKSRKSKIGLLVKKIVLWHKTWPFRHFDSRHLIWPKSILYLSLTWKSLPNFNESTAKL